MEAYEIFQEVLQKIYGMKNPLLFTNMSEVTLRKLLLHERLFTSFIR